MAAAGVALFVLISGSIFRLIGGIFAVNTCCAYIFF